MLLPVLTSFADLLIFMIFLIGFGCCKGFDKLYVHIKLGKCFKPFNSLICITIKYVYF